MLAARRAKAMPTDTLIEYLKVDISSLAELWAYVSRAGGRRKVKFHSRDPARWSAWSAVIDWSQQMSLAAELS